MASVRLENIKKVYEGNVVAVHEMDLEVKDKEFVVLVGPSGCGKSTTLRMIAGLEEITAGDLFIDGQRVNDVAPKDRDIAMVFQNYALYPHMSVYENMAFGLKLRKLPKQEIDERVREAAAILGIGDYLDRKPKALSGGQRQRVAVGRAIVRKPKVFLFDEPLSNLDAKLRVQMRTEISKLHVKLGATMIYVTHDQTEAMTMGDKIVLMKDGFVQQIESPMKIYANPVNKFVAGFIGSPAMNFFEGSIEKGTSLTFIEKPGGLRVPIQKKDQGHLKAYIGKDLILGLRPEQISIAGSAAASGSRTKAKVTVEVVEPMGNETYVYFSTRKDGPQFVARVTTTKEPAVGKPLDLFFDMGRAHFFDRETEKTIQ
ncbi:MAG: sn-glycerol-3-phosphate ABC transporter ATP-binding protein UgpC [Ignavibacteriales bacterium]|nr:sn-glycerol-3-phosphate ABC transporter ATP-binding protein UgpC [Ignavibacteriales bacterium]